MIKLQWFVLSLLIATAPTAQAQQPNRVALLIGNASYSVGRLTNPPQDVQAMETALNKLGFKVQKVLNANQNQMKRAVRDFGNSAQGADVAFLYYSGHGTQANGENYLLPVGASIDKESDYAIEAIAANDVLQQIRGARPKAAILVLDACRDNPLAATTRSTTKGLGRMDAPTGTMIAFATAPNTVASDNGDYAKVLSRELQKQGQELIDVFRNTTAEVRRLSAGKQEPRISEMSITERVYLAGPGVLVASVSAEPTGRTAQTDPEEEVWQVAKTANSTLAYEGYLDEYPKGRYAAAARVAAKIAQAAQSRVPPQSSVNSNFSSATESMGMVGGKGLRFGHVDADRLRKAIGLGSGPDDVKKMQTMITQFAKKYHFGIVTQEAAFVGGGGVSITDLVIRAQTAELGEAALRSTPYVGSTMRFVNTERITTESKPAKEAQARLEREFSGRARDSTFKSDHNERRNEELQKLLDRASSAIRRLAAADGYQLVIQEVLYADQSMDITDKALAMINSNTFE